MGWLAGWAGSGAQTSLSPTLPSQSYLTLFLYGIDTDMKDSGTKAASRALGDVAEMKLKYSFRVRD